MKKWVTKNGCEIHQILRGRSNSFLVSNGKMFILIDTGWKHSYKSLIKRIEELGVNEKSLVALILTHTHFDHAENALRIKERFKTKIYVHKTEAEFLIKGENPRIHGTNFVTRFFTDLIATKFIQRCKYEPVEYDYLIDDNYILDTYGFKAYIIHTPGHTVGSISLIIDNEIAIVGDAMFGIFKRSVYPPFADDPKIMIQSWGKLLNTGCSVFLPAHGSANSRELLQRQYAECIKKYGSVI